MFRIALMLKPFFFFCCLKQICPSFNFVSMVNTCMFLFQGQMTGVCRNETKTCEVLAWCPVEDDNIIPEYVETLNYSHCTLTRTCHACNNWIYSLTFIGLHNCLYSTNMISAEQPQHTVFDSFLFSFPALLCWCLQRTTHCSSKIRWLSPYLVSQGDEPHSCQQFDQI